MRRLAAVGVAVTLTVPLALVAVGLAWYDRARRSATVAAVWDHHRCWRLLFDTDDGSVTDAHPWRCDE